jgi:N-acetylglutamate synthase-like GNAT family acetyltransferase
MEFQVLYRTGGKNKVVEDFKNILLENIDNEHLCCAISDKKHQQGVSIKKQWLKEQIPQGHIFRKLDERGKVFIEYAPLEIAWVPVVGDNYIYIYCLWVSGAFKGKGYATQLLSYCIDDAKKQGKSGVCILTSKKKKPFLSEKKFMQKFGFDVVDAVGEYELLALAFDKHKPAFAKLVKEQSIENKELTIYYGMQCPCIPDCIQQIKAYSENSNIPVK